MVNEAGQGCKVILSATQKYPYQLIGANESYSTLDSLKGKAIAGGLSANSGPTSFIKACVNSAGLNADTDVSLPNVASSGYLAAMDQDEIQAAVSTNPWSAKQLLDAGGVVIVDGTDDAEIESIIGSSSYELFTVITSDALIQSDPEPVSYTHLQIREIFPAAYRRRQPGRHHQHRSQQAAQSFFPMFHQGHTPFLLPFVY